MSLGQLHCLLYAFTDGMVANVWRCQHTHAVPLDTARRAKSFLIMSSSDGTARFPVVRDKRHFVQR